MDVFLALLQGIALLIALTYLYALFMPSLLARPRFMQSITIGILFGIFTIFSMINPIELSSGVIFDPRHVIIMVSGIVGGLRAGLLTFTISGAYRYYLGGLGLMPGLGSMLTAALLGAAYHYFRDGKITFDRITVLIGILLGFVPPLWALTLVNPADPTDPIGVRMSSQIAIPFMILYPIATCILMGLIHRAYRHNWLQQALTRSEKRFRAVFSQNQQPFCLLRPDGIIIEANEAFRQSIAYVDGQAVRFCDFKWATEQDKPILQQFIRRAANGETVQSSVHLGSDEQTMVLDFFLQPLQDNDGNMTLIMAQVRNQTDQWLAEKRKFELQFERERNDILQQFVADASHHFRTPLAIMHSSLYLLKRHTEKFNQRPVQAPAEKQWLQKISDSTERLNAATKDLGEIVEDLLNMMRLDSPSDQNFFIVDFVDIANEHLQQYQDVASTKNITLNVDKPDVNLYVELEPEAMRIVISNLVENALRYTPAGGTIEATISTRDNKFAILSIKDTGIGIPQEEQDKIFHRFFRATTGKEFFLKGTGLGLAIVKKTMEMHKGFVEVESEVGVGSTFSIGIPLIDEPLHGKEKTPTTVSRM